MRKPAPLRLDTATFNCPEPQLSTLQQFINRACCAAFDAFSLPRMLEHRHLQLFPLSSSSFRHSFSSAARFLVSLSSSKTDCMETDEMVRIASTKLRLMCLLARRHMMHSMRHAQGFTCRSVSNPTHHAPMNQADQPTSSSARLLGSKHNNGNSTKSSHQCASVSALPPVTLPCMTAPTLPPTVRAPAHGARPVPLGRLIYIL